MTVELGKKILRKAMSRVIILLTACFMVFGSVPNIQLNGTNFGGFGIASAEEDGGIYMNGSCFGSPLFKSSLAAIGVAAGAVAGAAAAHAVLKSSPLGWIFQFATKALLVAAGISFVIGVALFGTCIAIDILALLGL